MADELPVLPAGVWRHYKGPLYQVLGYGHDADADVLCTLDAVEVWEGTGRLRGDPPPTLGERNVVVYIGLELDQAHKGPRFAVRTAEWFLAMVCTRTEHRHYGEMVTDQDAIGPCEAVRRFAYVGPEWTG